MTFGSRWTSQLATFSLIYLFALVLVCFRRRKGKEKKKGVNDIKGNCKESKSRYEWEEKILKSEKREEMDE